MTHQSIPAAQILVVLSIVFALTTPPLYGQQSPQGESSDWQIVDIPGDWKTGYGKRSQQTHYQWYRCTAKVPSHWKGEPLELFIEGADDAREVYFNGKSIGLSGTFPPEYRSGLGGTFRFPIPAEIVDWGSRNVLSVKVYYNSGRTGLNIAAPVLMSKNEAIRLSGQWQVRVGQTQQWGQLTVREGIPTQANFEKQESRESIEQSLKALFAGDQPQSVPETLKQLKTPDDLSVDVVLSEPDIGQPLSMKWDARGRLWLVEYLQYPHPAGLKSVSRDKFLRSAYDQLPQPPPNHFPGADRISIHEDTNGDGTYDSHKTFLDGMSLMSSFEFSEEGVYVLCPPYLLFYPDRNHDDIPDSDPEVLLEGFGIEDSHSVANSLRWGPDGWLYSTQGSTVSGQVKHYGTKDPPVHSLGQLVWRYHPPTKRYEIFAEGGGNAFGVEFDSRGHLFSGHNGSNTRGFHYIQGGYYKKGFGKHGPLSNPFTYGYFQSMQHHRVPRFSHHFLVYEAQALPTEYSGKMFSIAPLQSEVVLSDRSNFGATYTTKDTGYAFQSQDSWVRPVDIQLGPDGCVYVADMYEQRIDHASHYQGRIHKKSGRIYRLRGNQNSKPQSVSLADASTDQLLSALQSGNRWVRQTSRYLLKGKQEAQLDNKLIEALNSAEEQYALELLWVLQTRHQLNSELASRLLSHANPAVREWTVRLIGDSPALAAQMGNALAAAASYEKEPYALSQFACTARKLKTEDTLKVVQALIANRISDETFLPLLLWWAVEAKLSTEANQVVTWMIDDLDWSSELVQEYLINNSIRRLATSSKRAELILCAKLLDKATERQMQQPLLEAFELAFQGRSLVGLPDELMQALANSGGGSLELRLRQQQPKAISEAMRILETGDSKQSKLISVVRIVAEMKLKQAETPLMELLSPQTSEPVLQEVITGLQSYENPQIAEQMINLLSKTKSPELQSQIGQALASRKLWSIKLMTAVESSKIPKQSLTSNLLKRMLLHQNEELNAKIESLYGPLKGASNQQMLAEMKRIEQIVSSSHGNPYNGKMLYEQSCAKCHKLFSKGGEIGPDLTSHKRDDDFPMIANIVNPSLEIREGYENTMVITLDGRAVTGFIEDQDTQVLILRTPEGSRVLIPQDEIDLQERLPTSVMPEGLLDKLTDDQLKDLFAYLRSSQPLPE